MLVHEHVAALPGVEEVEAQRAVEQDEELEAATNGVAMTTSSDVEKFAHTSSGMRKKLMPGARMVMIVTRKFSAVAIDDALANCTPMVKKTWPIGAVVDSGA